MGRLSENLGADPVTDEDLAAWCDAEADRKRVEAEGLCVEAGQLSDRAAKYRGENNKGKPDRWLTALAIARYSDADLTALDQRIG